MFPPPTRCPLFYVCKIGFSTVYAQVRRSLRRHAALHCSGRGKSDGQRRTRGRQRPAPRHRRPGRLLGWCRLSRARGVRRQGRPSVRNRTCRPWSARRIRSRSGSRPGPRPPPGRRIPLEEDRAVERQRAGTRGRCADRAVRGARRARTRCWGHYRRHGPHAQGPSGNASSKALPRGGTGRPCWCAAPAASRSRNRAGAAAPRCLPRRD